MDNEVDSQILTHLSASSDKLTCHKAQSLLFPVMAIKATAMTSVSLPSDDALLSQILAFIFENFNK